MPRATPFTQAELDKRKLGNETRRVTVEMIARLDDMRSLPNDRLEVIAGQINEVLQQHHTAELATRQETPAGILAALRPVAEQLEGLLKHLSLLPLSLRHELAIDEAALRGRLDNIKIVAGKYELRRVTAGHVASKDALRKELTARLLPILGEHCPKSASDRRRALRWVADVQRAARLVVPDETKNPGRLMGGDSRARSPTSRRKVSTK